MISFSLPGPLGLEINFYPVGLALWFHSEWPNGFRTKEDETLSRVSDTESPQSKMHHSRLPPYTAEPAPRPSLQNFPSCSLSTVSLSFPSCLVCVGLFLLSLSFLLCSFFFPVSQFIVFPALLWCNW